MDFFDKLYFLLEKCSSKNSNLTDQQKNIYRNKISKRVEGREFLSFPLLLLTIIQENISSNYVFLNFLIKFGQVFLASLLLVEFSSLLILLVNDEELAKYRYNDIKKYNELANKKWKELDINSLLKILIEYNLALQVYLGYNINYLFILLVFSLTIWIVLNFGNSITSSIFGLLLVFYTIKNIISIILTEPNKIIWLLTVVPPLLYLLERKRLKIYGKKNK